jgi:glucose-6-phosphate isomerase
MTRRFLEEPFERNPVLQYAAVNYLMTQEYGKPIRVLAIWSKKLESLGLWHDQLVSECLGKQGQGPTPLSVVQTRDLFGSGQLHQEGPRDKLINNLVLKQPRTPPLVMGMADHNEDDLSALNRKSFPDLLDAALRASNRAHFDTARPTADLVLPTLSEHTMGQLLQMLMLATVVEGKLMGVNPYSRPGLELYQSNMRQMLKQ